VQSSLAAWASWPHSLHTLAVAGFNVEHQLHDLDVSMEVPLVEKPDREEVPTRRSKSHRECEGSIERLRLQFSSRTKPDRIETVIGSLHFGLPTHNARMIGP
jgi:hypothetical protein